MTSDIIAAPRDRMFIRSIFPDGRCTVLCAWKDGEWKVEVFASEAHALNFADQHNMEVTRDASSSGS
jgi:hypothetical protein